jgi:hypothetical protein
LTAHVRVEELTFPPTHARVQEDTDDYSKEEGSKIK